MVAIKNKIPVLTPGTYGKHYFSDTTVGSKNIQDPLEYVELKKRNTFKDTIPAHRLDFYMIQLVTSGGGMLRQGLKDYCIRKQMLIFTSPAMINTWQAHDAQQEGFVISFSDSFINRGREDKRTLSNLPFFKMDGCAVLALSADQFSDYITLFEMMQREFERSDARPEPVVKELISVILMKAKSDHLNAPSAHMHSLASNRLLCLFTDLYMKDISRIQQGREVIIRKLSEYATELGVTQNHLNDSVREVTGKSAGTLIREQIIRQATMCLRQSSKSVSEIAYLLGFQDPSYFSRYYKKLTGKLPSEVRSSTP